mmetsp:Transcript_27460/g.43244  ORF Transcript_27460/g.43244 Transcript_27460/m.43244 type:complete len:210 (-) Transcript_27460:388-1017(-)
MQKTHQMPTLACILFLSRRTFSSSCGVMRSLSFASKTSIPGSGLSSSSCFTWADSCAGPDSASLLQKSESSSSSLLHLLLLEVDVDMQDVDMLKDISFSEGVRFSISSVIDPPGEALIARRVLAVRRSLSSDFRRLCSDSSSSIFFCRFLIWTFFLALVFRACIRFLSLLRSDFSSESVFCCRPCPFSTTSCWPKMAACDSENTAGGCG